jgi:DNA-binding transcriptional MerR regulator
MQFEPKKLYYKIREVCDIVGVESHVLRFWETEFPTLSPPKSKSGQRTYRPKDIELLLQIRKLLYEDGFTIAGARRRLSAGAASHLQSREAVKSSRRGRVKELPKPKPAPASEPLSKVKSELENILTLLDRE